MPTTTRVVVMGLGRLGLPMASVLAENPNLEVVGLDINSDLVDVIREGRVPIPEPGTRVDKIAEVTTDPDTALAGADAVFIVVNTPPNPPAVGPFVGLDHRQAYSAIDQVTASRPDGSLLVVLVSTVEAVELDDLSTRLPDNCYLLYQPQFIALGRVVCDLRSPHLALYGVQDADAYADVQQVEQWWAGAACREHWAGASSAASRVVTLTYPEATVLKMALNAYLCQQIAFGQMLHTLTLKLGGRPGKVLGRPRAPGAFRRSGAPERRLRRDG